MNNPAPSLISAIRRRQHTQASPAPSLQQILAGITASHQLDPRVIMENQMNTLTTPEIVDRIQQHRQSLETPQGFLDLLASRISPSHDYEKILIQRLVSTRFHDRSEITQDQIQHYFNQQLQRLEQGLPNGLAGVMPEHYEHTSARFAQKNDEPSGRDPLCWPLHWRLLDYQQSRRQGQTRA